MSDELLSLLSPARLTHVVDVGANPIDGAPPYKQMLSQGLCTVTGFEPQEQALAALNERKGPLETYLPHALGSGGQATLNICHVFRMDQLVTAQCSGTGRFSTVSSQRKSGGANARVHPQARRYP